MRVEDEGKSRRAVTIDDAVTLRRIVEIVREMVGADTTCMASFDLLDTEWQWCAGAGVTEDRFAAGGDCTVRGSLSEAVRAGVGVVEVHGGEEGRHIIAAGECPVHHAEGVCSLAVAPLMRGRERLGALAVGFRRPHAFTPEEHARLTMLAEMAGFALDTKRLFQTVETAKRVWEMTFDAMRDCVMVHDGAGRIARVNRAAAEMLNRAPSEIIGRRTEDVVRELFGASAAMHWAHHRAAYSGDVAHEAKSASFEVRDKDNRRYLFSIAGFGARFHLTSEGDTAQDESRTVDGATGDETPWSVIAWSDITELAGMQEQLSRSGRLASINGLAAGVAHEINNPLAAITTCAEAITRDLRDLDAMPEATSLRSFAGERNWNFYLEEIVRQAFRGKAITRGLLDLTRARRARRTPVRINQLVHDTGRVFAARDDTGNTRIAFDVDESLETIATDADMVRQILDNLISNAIAAITTDLTTEVARNDSSSPPRITLRTRGDGAARIFVEVEDTGSGIRPEILARIFDPFFTTKRGTHGSGLGLAMCASLADALGGSITVETKEGVGSRFRLWLPLVPEEVMSNE